MSGETQLDAFDDLSAPANPLRDTELMDHPLTEKQRFSWLRLIRCENVGPATFRDLFNHFGSAEKALEALPNLSRRGGAKKAPKIASLDDIEAEWEQIYSAGARLVALGEKDYPHALAFTHAPPPLLCVAGDGKWAQSTIVSIVGSRNCSASGLKMAQILATELGKAGIAVASGLARGIDTSAHKASLDTGTIAVLAGGLNRIYPKENYDLAHAIARNGMLISEMPFNWQARARDFPRRNRIVSGIAAGIVVIEAAKRSGSLITARYALEQDREVFAVPGSPLDPRSSGTNHLIKQGANLVSEVDDILNALNFHSPISPSPQIILREKSTQNQSYEHDLPGDARSEILRALSPTPIALDDLMRLTNMAPEQIQLALLELDLAGRLERHGNQAVSLRPI